MLCFDVQKLESGKSLLGEEMNINYGQRNCRLHCKTKLVDLNNAGLCLDR